MWSKYHYKCNANTAGSNFLWCLNLQIVGQINFFCFLQCFYFEFFFLFQWMKWQVFDLSINQTVAAQKENNKNKHSNNIIIAKWIESISNVIRIGLNWIGFYFRIHFNQLCVKLLNFKWKFSFYTHITLTITYDVSICYINNAIAKMDMCACVCMLLLLWFSGIVINRVQNLKNKHHLFLCDLHPCESHLS